ncbi:hemerythrin domain-containing protein [Salinisphaera sp. G21_0]|uniref:hemerythrin domain-containing protein n=1 Tax=Salinisphaera sp. G21_0 TaxID=2821094 RepID=UPI001ADA5605|nr:hemerythrin domain-containing protein [Salinisphaera sp. G21_0]MBO9482964.1 hemerythrin domain-containing protein [Salinisphaera sp. G21_0]
MSMLIRELKHEHLQISDLLVKARAEGVASEAGRELVLSAKKMLLAHLNKEDRYLYPPLREAAAKDESLKSMLSDYALDMDKISVDVMAFFNLYESTDQTSESFHSDCDNIIKALCKRIAKEETVLYKIYDQIYDQIINS